MEHLPVHLAQEADLGGPVHYRWMYPFERFFHWLKQKVKKQVSAGELHGDGVLDLRIKTFGSHYFDRKLPAMMATIPRNEVWHGNRVSFTLSVFHTKGSPFGRARKNISH